MKKPNKLPTIHSVNGRRYIILGKKKYYFSKDMSERELIKFIINRLAKSRKRKRKAKTQSEDKYAASRKTETKSLGTKTLTNPADVSKAVKSNRELDDAKAQIEQEKKKQEELKKEKQDEIKRITDESKAEIAKLEARTNEYLRIADEVLPDEDFKRDDINDKGSAFRYMLINAKRELKAKERELKEKLQELNDKNMTVQDLNKYIAGMQKHFDDLNATLQTLRDKEAEIQKEIEALHRKGEEEKQMQNKIREDHINYVVKDLLWNALDDAGFRKVAKELGMKGAIQKKTYDFILHKLMANDDPSVGYIDVDKVKATLRAIPYADLMKINRDDSLHKIGLTLDDIKVYPQQAVEQGDEDEDEEDEQAVMAAQGKGPNAIDRSGTLNNLQIDQLMKRYDGYLGTIANDEIPTVLNKIKPKSRVSCIINTDNHNKPGRHWVAVFADARPNGSQSIEYFDSFAEDPSKQVDDGIRDIAEKLDSDQYLKYKINHIVVQDDDTSNCGWFCVKFLMDRYRGIPFRECTGYDDHVKGEKGIEAFKNKFKKFDYIITGQGIKETVEDAIDSFKQFFTGRTSSPELKRFIAKNGDDVITSMTVCRKPIESLIRNALNIITLGKFEQVTKKMSYDNLFHLFLNFTTAKGSYITERNEVVRVYNGKAEGDTISVPLNKSITVKDFFGKALQKEGTKIFQYDAVKNNCQDYIMTLLSANGLNNGQLTAFIKQDIVTLFKQLPDYTEKIAKALTEFAARLKILWGQGQ